MGLQNDVIDLKKILQRHQWLLWSFNDLSFQKRMGKIASIEDVTKDGGIYKNYIPDHAKRMETAARYVTEHGYEPVFFHEGFLGVPHP
ncbi:MAG: hypothetical protein J5743_04720, partial [Victivallales bacterium]|nr:hypothetical protein [Victivallales bacterium]